MEKEALAATCIQFSVPFQPESALKEMMQSLAEKINQMITNDFEGLVQQLYRMDISEVKLKELLKANPTQNAGAIIAGLLVERQAQKIKSRQENSREEDFINEDEKW